MLNFLTDPYRMSRRPWLVKSKLPGYQSSWLAAPQSRRVATVIDISINGAVGLRPLELSFDWTELILHIGTLPIEGRRRAEVAVARRVFCSTCRFPSPIHNVSLDGL